MRWFNWSEAYRQRPVMTGGEMLEAVEKFEHGYWPWLILAVVLHVFGLCLMLAGCFLDTRLLVVGGVMALDGSILNCTLKVVAHTRLQGLQIMMQTENRIQQELRRVDAMEL